VNKMLFEPSVQDDPLKFIIRSSDPAQPTAFIATAQTQEEKNEWVRYISEQLDQQKRMLAALVDPRRFMGGATDDLSGSMAEQVKARNRQEVLEVQVEQLRGRRGIMPIPQTIRQEEHLRGVACCAYRHLRKGEVDLESGEEVEILEVSGGYSHVLKENGQDGLVPSYFLELVDIPGETLAEQIEYRLKLFS
ncbi:variant SH3 domain protein, partial [Teladorsagia circumcincta]